MIKALNEIILGLCYCHINVLDLKNFFYISIYIFKYCYYILYYMYDYYIFVTFDIIGSPYIFAFVDGTNLKQPLTRPIYIRPPENNYEGHEYVAREWNSRRLRSPHYSLVDISNLVRSRAPQGIHFALAHESCLCLGIWETVGMRFSLNPLYTFFRIQ